MEKNIFKYKNYKHIDKKRKIDEINGLVKNKNFIIKHGFYPFLSYTDLSEKYVKIGKNEYRRKEKERPIKYASHIDRYIYQWYSYLFNNKYNEYCNIHNLNKSVIAYRTCMKGKTNIEFSKVAFDYIKQTKECYVLVSDFSNFFDNIEHSLLKDNICRILNVEKMEDDYYKVYKSMTSYSYIEKDVIIQYLIENNIETFESIKKCDSLLDNTEWKKVKKDLKNSIIKNKKTYGIPQGSPLSGIFANIYMIDFDEKMSQFAYSNNGIYMRYSDDIIIVIPKSKIESIRTIWNEIEKVKKDYSTMIINIDKTCGYLYENNEITSLHNELLGMKDGKRCISYLGFSFDGKNIKFRDKTLTKFFNKLYKKIDYMLEREKRRIEVGKKRHTKIDKHQIIKEVTRINSKSRKFIDYVNRATKVYPNEKYICGFKREVKEKIFNRFNKAN